MSASNTIEGTAASRPGRPVAIGRASIIAAAISCVDGQRSLTSLGLREVARAAGIAPNSIYRHFGSIDELTTAVIEQSGASLRQILATVRRRVDVSRSVIQMCTEVFFAQLDGQDPGLRILLREGRVGSERLRGAVKRQLEFFEDELCVDLQRLAGTHGDGVYQPELTARAITELVFTMAARGLDVPASGHPGLINETADMVRTIVTGAQARAAQSRGGSAG